MWRVDYARTCKPLSRTLKFIWKDDGAVISKTGIVTCCVPVFFDKLLRGCFVFDGAWA